ncbi:hypothetical protein ACP70R_025026 [Stipagrostis hirtigluma subsp. patula]
MPDRGRPHRPTLFRSIPRGAAARLELAVVLVLDELTPATDHDEHHDGPSDELLAPPMPSTSSLAPATGVSKLQRMVLSDDDVLDRWWEEEEESDENNDNNDDEDIYIALGVLADMVKKKRKKKHGGSIPGRQIVRRNIASGNWRIVQDYFADPPVYNEKFFRRRFRMSKPLFLRIVDAVEAHDDYFRQRANAVGLLGATPLQKMML